MAGRAIVIGRTEWLYGCIRITIQPESTGTDGKALDNFTIDEPQCEVLEAGVLEARPFWRADENESPAALGPRPDAQREPDPGR